MKYFFKRVLPTPDLLHKSRLLRPMIHHLKKAMIWQVNRRTIALGVAIGIFFGALPIPVQMPAVAMTALLVRANLPIALVCTWWSNPFTFAPVFYFNYRVGAFIHQLWTGQPPQALVINHFDMNMLKTLSGQVLLPLFTGSVAVGVILAIVGYCVILLAWRISLVRHYSQRKERHRQALLQAPPAPENAEPPAPRCP